MDKYRIEREYPADEITKDPIFLLQSRRYVVFSIPYGYEYDGEDIIKHIEGEEDEVLDGKDIYEKECAIETWETESVWFTREEAEIWGESHKYRYADGWRVYCIHTEGELAILLRRHTVERKS